MRIHEFIAVFFLLFFCFWLQWNDWYRNARSNCAWLLRPNTTRCICRTQSFIGRSCLSLASTITTIMRNYLQLRAINLYEGTRWCCAGRKQKTIQFLRDRQRYKQTPSSPYVLSRYMIDANLNPSSMRSAVAGRWVKFAYEKCVAIASVRIISTHCAYGPGEVATKRYSDHNKRPIPSLLATLGARLLSAFV